VVQQQKRQYKKNQPFDIRVDFQFLKKKLRYFVHVSLATHSRHSKKFREFQQTIQFWQSADSGEFVVFDVVFFSSENGFENFQPEFNDD
jgi:hypothetical protein